MNKGFAAANRQVEEMEAKQKALARELYQDNQTVKKYQHLLKIYKAGMIFKEAGILDSYDHDKVLQILQEYKKGGKRIWTLVIRK